MENQQGEGEKTNMRDVIREVIQEFVSSEQSKAEPAYKTELIEERKRREQLERRLNELAEENKRSRQAAEAAERSATVRAELQRLGVNKLELAYRAVKDDVYRTEDGRLAARGPHGEMGLREYLGQFVSENPELLPARMVGGSGLGPAQRPPATAEGGPLELERIRPGMSAEELEKVRQEVARVANQTLMGR